MQLFYDPTLSIDTKEFRFDKTESKHIVRVLRKKEGDILHITNGNGMLFSGRISSALASHCIVQIELVEQKTKPWNYYLHIAIAPTKNMDRLEWFIEKAAEIGIDEITPILCARSERKVLKNERLDKILEGAMKQSLKFQLPKLNELQTLKSFLKLPHDGQLFMAHCDETDRKSFKNELGKNQKITVLIGPEGDFSPEEIKLAIQQKFVPVTLGESRLRTETAGLVAVQSVAFFNG
ncbi:MAG: 16S rRNA (uracil(1498)-N(3))-methyltransferase [Flavobacteriaceae bacterium]|nr:16S rRNA (uracil(1498)-N(3))-methyltransferase [Flavobacteriaceae bacterium]